MAKFVVGCYLFANEAKPLLKNYVSKLSLSSLGVEPNINKEIDKDLLKKINFEINNHPIEKIGLELRKSMTALISPYLKLLACVNFNFNSLLQYFSSSFQDQFFYYQQSLDL